MSYLLNNLNVSLSDAFMQFYNSPFILAVKILAGIYLAVLFLDVIMLVILRDVSIQLRVGLRGMDFPMTTRRKMQTRWSKITERLQSENVSQYKVAIIEADVIADEILGKLGYRGTNMTERLEQVGTAHLDDHLEALKGAHEIRNRIIHETDFAVDERLAKAIVGVYANFLKYIELL